MILQYIFAFKPAGVVYALVNFGNLINLMFYDVQGSARAEGMKRKLILFPSFLRGCSSRNNYYVRRP